ncbi:MAG: hypothetical protein ACOCZH_01835 [Phototrophicaceae bacterium]
MKRIFDGLAFWLGGGAQRKIGLDEQVYFAEFGTERIDTGDAQAELNGKKLPAYPLRFPVQGGGQMLRRGRWFLRPSGDGGQRLDSAGDYRVSGAGGGGGVMVGFVLGNWLRLYPLLGVRWAGGEAVVGHQDPAAEDGITHDPDKRVRFDDGGAWSVLGLGVELRIGWRYGLVIGAHAGYRFPLTDSGHMFNGPYARLFAGFARLRPAEKAAGATG